MGSNQQTFTPQGFDFGAITRQGILPAAINALVNGRAVKNYAQSVNAALPDGNKLDTSQYGPFAFNYMQDINNIQQRAAAARQQSILDELNTMMGQQFVNPAVANEYYEKIYVPGETEQQKRALNAAGAQQALEAMGITPEMLGGGSQAKAPPRQMPALTQLNGAGATPNFENDPYVQQNSAPPVTLQAGRPLEAGASMQGGPMLYSSEDLERLAKIIPSIQNTQAQTGLYGAQARYNDAGVGYRQAQTQTENVLRAPKVAYTQSQTQANKARAHRLMNPVFAPPGPNRQIEYAQWLQKNPSAAVKVNKTATNPINISKDQLKLLNKDPAKLNALEKQVVKNLTLRIAANSASLEAQGIKAPGSDVNQEYLDTLGLGKE